MAKLILIDGNAILHRAYHALPPLTTKYGEPINAVYGLISMLLKVIQDLKPTHIAVCFDEPGFTFRHKLYKEYQARRPMTEVDLLKQFIKARAVIKAFGIPAYSMAGYEADDLIGTLAQQAKEDVVVITGDRDILQLVNDRVKVYMPIAGLSGGKLYGEKEVVERLGIPPSQVDDFKALVGDQSDNYPGVAGIGPIGAIRLLEKYKTLENIYKHVKEITPATKEKLINYKEDAFMSKKLATIDKNVPIKLDIDSAGKWDLDSSSVIELFGQFGFKTLTERVKKVGRQLDQEKQMTLL